MISMRGADLDPEIRQFVAGMSAAFASYPSFNDLHFPEMRRACEQLRALGDGRPDHVAENGAYAPNASGRRSCAHSQPVGARRRPALIYMHGGGIDTHDRIMREHAARGDIVVPTPFPGSEVPDGPAANCRRRTLGSSAQRGAGHHRDRIVPGSSSRPT